MADKSTAAEAKKRVKKPKKSKLDAESQAARFRPKVRKRNQLPRGEHGGLKLLLIEDVQHVGQQGQVVEVKPGYGRNYLIPQGLATYVTAETLSRIEKHKQKVEALRIARLSDLKLLAKKLESYTVTLEVNATEEGHLYGSVTGHDVAEALRKEGFDLTNDHVEMEGAIKELGLYQISVRLDPEVQSDVKVWVVASGTE